MTTHIPQLTLPHALFANPAASILLPVALGTGVGYSTRPKKTEDTYKLIRQPPLAPPGYVFGPVWTLLYGLMGYAAHRAVVSRQLTPSTIKLLGPAATLYSVQLGLNLLWMPLFFGLRRPAIALADITALLGMNGYLAYLFMKIDRVAGWCYVPYVVWLSFATYLNVGVGILNEWKIKDEDLNKED